MYSSAKHDEAPTRPAFRRCHRWPSDPQSQGVVPGGIDRVGSPQVVMKGATPEKVSEGGSVSYTHLTLPTICSV
eukprot:8957000-Alexandrium_andersonii.AAC.1